MADGVADGVTDTGCAGACGAIDRSGVNWVLRAIDRGIASWVADETEIADVADMPDGLHKNDVEPMTASLARDHRQPAL